MRVIEISVVVPAYNEGSVLKRTLDEIEKVLRGENSTYEIIVVNDGSTDSTKNVIDNRAAASEAITPVELSRNYGKEAALAAGLSLSNGACVVFMDADLQHPPSIIPKMLEKWRAGFDVVNAKKIRRGRESRVYRASANLFNWIMSKAIGSDMSGASDFKLIDRQVADALMRCPERNRFFRGLVAWVGFRTTDIEFEVGERGAGTTKWSAAMLLQYSLRNLVTFSSLPLQVVAFVGFGIAVVGVVLLGQTLLNYILGRAAIGFTTVIAVEILMGGMIILSLGVLSLYVSKIYDEQKARPLFLVRTERVVDQRRGEDVGKRAGNEVAANKE